MTNDTVEQLCADIKTRIDELWEQSLGAMLNGEVDEFADRILAAHKREMDELVDASVRTNELLVKQIAEKDAEIARIKSVLSELFKRSLPKCTTCDCVCDECFECSLSDLVPLIKWSLEGVQFDPNDYSNLPLFKKEVAYGE